jgi:hypothetical protein
MDKMERRLVGFWLIVAGALFFMERLNLIQLHFSIWSVAWVLIGGYLIKHGVQSGRRRWGMLGFGGWMAAVGLLDVLAGMGLSPVGGEMVRPLFWPILLLGVGFAILTGKFRAQVIWDGGNWNHQARRWGAVGDSRVGGPGFVLSEDLVVSHGIGESRIDLSQAEVAPGIWNVTLEQGIGDAAIFLPGNVSVRVEANVGLGDLEALGDRRSGITPSLKRELIVPDAEATLIVRGQLGLGRLRIIQAVPFGDARREGRTVRSIVDLEMEG